jgi:hypothetical protein
MGNLWAIAGIVATIVVGILVGIYFNSKTNQAFIVIVKMIYQLPGGNSISGLYKDMKKAGLTSLLPKIEKKFYQVDRETIQIATATFFFDTHTGPVDGIWGQGVQGHYFPTIDGKPSPNNIDELLKNASVDARYFANGANGAIWMGLLVNEPAMSSAVDNSKPGSARPLPSEHGPYLNDMPISASQDNGNEKGTGSYTWVICADGKVFGLHWNKRKNVWQEVMMIKETI